MGLLAVIGFIVIAYYVINALLWTLLDCDVELFFTSKLGKPISKSPAVPHSRDVNRKHRKTHFRQAQRKGGVDNGRIEWDRTWAGKSAGDERREACVVSAKRSRVRSDEARVPVTVPGHAAPRRYSRHSVGHVEVRVPSGMFQSSH